MKALLSGPPGFSSREVAAAIEARIEAHLRALDGLIALLDSLEGDPDLEPTLGAPERHPRPCHWGVGYSTSGHGDQTMWADGDNSAPADDAEVANEDGDELDKGELSEHVFGSSECSFETT